MFGLCFCCCRFYSIYSLVKVINCGFVSHWFDVIFNTFTNFHKFKKEELAKNVKFDPYFYRNHFYATHDTHIKKILYQNESHISVFCSCMNKDPLLWSHIIFFNDLMDHIVENVYDRMEKRNEKITFLCLARVFYCYLKFLFGKKRIKRETLLHFTNRYEYKFVIKAGGIREEKTMKMNTHR